MDDDKLSLLIKKYNNKDGGRNTLVNSLWNSVDYLFEPCITVFDKAIVINYKKTGSRFFQTISSYPEHPSNSNNKQLDLIFSKVNNSVSEPVNIGTILYVKNPFDLDNFRHDDSQWKDLKEFFDKNEVSSWQEFFVRNKKEIVFVIRNPIDRFLSGLTQIVSSLINHDLQILSIREDICRNTNLTTQDLRLVMNNFSSSEIATDREIYICSELIIYLLKYRSELILQDIHTDNYLLYFKLWIDTIKDKSKIKIIDLGQCNSEKALELFNTFRNDDLLNDFWREKEKYIESNKKVYLSTLQILQNSEKDIDWIRFIKNEISFYLDLLESKYFYDIDK